jgi:hypothetical protein
MKQLIIILLFSCSSYILSAQNDPTCTVAMDSIKGTYTGECKNGKANGNGKSVGVHTYDGEFKNGLPEGKGKYTWANGDYYYGNWKKGQKDGKGELHRFEEGKESLVTGFWKKDNYKGEYENPYVIQNVSQEVGRVQATKLNDKEETITITVQNLLGGGSFGSSGFSTATTMTAHNITRGTYISKSNNALTNKEVTVFRGVVFPFRATFNFGNTMIDIEFFEKGAWDVYIPINR